MMEIKTSPDGLTFKVCVQPKSSRNQISGLYGDALKLKITSAPVDGAANKMCLQFLSKQLGIAKSRLEIVSGPSSRTKRILIKAPAEDRPALKRRLLALAK